MDRESRQPFFWVSVADGNVCPDCLLIEATQPREGRTLEEWIALYGLPGSGHTICRDKCRCSLMEAAYIENSEALPEVDLRGDKIVFIRTDGEIGELPPLAREFLARVERLRKMGKTEADIQRILWGKPPNLPTLIEELDRVIIEES